MSLLNLTQAAEYLGRKPNGLRKLVNSGRGPRFQRTQPAGRFYFRTEWLDEWIEQTATAPQRKPQPPIKSQFGLDATL